MTTVDSSYIQPAFVILGLVDDGVLVDGFNDGSSHDNVAKAPFVMRPGDSATLNPVWYSSYSTAQVQYRVRHRYNYASGLVMDDTGAEVWTDYPDWTEPSGATTVSDCTYETSLGRTGTRRYAPAVTVAFSYDLSQYDMHEVEVRVRVYNATADKCSEWSYGTRRIAYMPTLAGYTAETLADGSTELSFTASWPRGCELHLGEFSDVRDGSMFMRGYEVTVSSDGSAKIPASYAVRNVQSIAGDFWPQRAYILTDDYRTFQGTDGGCSLIAYADGGYLVEPGAHVDPQDVPVPTLTVISDDGEAVVIGVACACDHVLAHVEYADADGIAYTADMEPAGASPDWTVTLMSPPYGVPITVKVACCNASGAYRLATETVEIASDGHCTLDGDGDHVALAYEGEYQSQTDLDGESVICAGRKLPVSRHGMSVSRSIDVKGTIAFPSVFPWGDMELSGLNVLDNPHDWVFRNPKGVRKRVRVASWSVDQSPEQLGRLAEVTINMEEVG